MRSWRRGCLYRASGNNGAQVCVADGSGYAACNCSGGGGAPGTGGGGGSSGSGVSGSGGGSGSTGIAGNVGSGGSAGTTGSGLGGASGSSAGRGGSGGGTGGTGQAGTGGTARPSWTVLVYANGDSNIGASLFSDMVEMMSASLTSDIGLYLYADFPADQLIPGTTDRFPTGTEYDRILGNGNFQTLDIKPEEDFDDPNVLSEAVRSVFASHPADRYGLILWDHGGGWRYGFGGDLQNGTRASASGMPFEVVASAVRSGLTAANLRNSPPPLEFFAFNTCLLGSPEVAAPFASLTKTFIADAEIDYGDGWDYRSTFTWLSANPAVSAADFAKQEVAFWDAHHRTSILDRLFKSHVALDTSALNSFTASVDSVVSAVRANAGATETARAFVTSLPDYFVINIDYDSGGAPIPLKDVGQVIQTLTQSPNAQISAAATAARSALSSFVLARASGSARAGQSGLNVGAGPPIQFDAFLSAIYRQLAPTWDASTHWADLIDFVRAAADSTGPSISSTGIAGNSLPFRIDDPDLLSTDFDFWSISADNRYFVFLQLMNRFYVPPGAYQFNWSGNIVAIDAIPAPVVVSLLPWREVSGSAGIELPIFKSIGLIDDGYNTYYAELLVDRTALVADLALVTIGGFPQVFSIAQLAASNAVFWPVFNYFDASTGTWNSGTGTEAVALPNGSLRFTVGAPSPGKYAFSLDAEDTWGNVTSELFPFSLQ